MNRTRQSGYLQLVRLVLRQKKYWLLPLVLAVAILALLAAGAGTGAAPYIYTLF